MFNQLGVIGCGLMGGSFALALKRGALVKRVVGYSKSPSTTERALRMGVIDVVADSALQAVAGSDIVLLAVPVAATETTLKAIRHLVEPGVLVMDVGSTKRDVVDAARRALRERIASFVPAHPIAGKEGSGIQHADAALYSGRQVILTPLPQTTPALVQKATDVWSAIGAQVLKMTAENHDSAFAAVSHLPHLLAFAYFGGVLGQPAGRDLLSLAGPGFRDFTRIAASDPTMWRDVLLANREEVLKQSQRFRQSLDALEQVMLAGNGPALQELLRVASEGRRSGRWARRGCRRRASPAAGPRCTTSPFSTCRRCAPPPARCGCRARRASPTACCCWPRWPRAARWCTSRCSRTTRASCSMRCARWAAAVQPAERGALRIDGLGGRLRVHEAALFLGNAGTAMRPLAAVLALLAATQGGRFELSGVPRMHERPIGDLVDALRALGCDIVDLGQPGYPPLRVQGEPGGALRTGQPIPVRGDVSSQFLSALLLALPLVSQAQDIVIEVQGELISKPYVAITLNLLARFGIARGARGLAPLRRAARQPLPLARRDPCRGRCVLGLVLHRAGRDRGARRRAAAHRGRGQRFDPGRHPLRRRGAGHGRARCRPGRAGCRCRAAPGRCARCSSTATTSPTRR